MDGSVSFWTKLDNSGLVKDLQKAKKQIQDTMRNLNVNTSLRESVRKDLEGARAELEKLKNTGTWDPKQGIIRTDEQKTRISQLLTQISELEANEARYTQEIDKANKNLALQKGIAGEITQALAKAAPMNAMKKGFEAVKRATSGIVSGVKKFGSLAVSAGKKLYSGFNKKNGGFTDGIKNMLKYAIGFRSLYALVNKIKTAAKDAFKNLAQSNSGVNQSLSALQSSLGALKNSIGSALAPMLQAVTPVLTRLIDMFTAAANSVGRLSAALSGMTSFSAATKQQKNYAQSLSNTGKAAKEAQRQLMGFDELNIIGDNADSSGGGSAGGGFVTESIDPLVFDSWGEAFNAMLDSILNNGIPLLKSGFAKLSGWLNEYSSKLYQMFTFQGVQDKIREVGRGVADAINGLVMLVNWDQLGRALGAGIQTALSFLSSFITNTNWGSIGQKIGNFLTGAVAEINWADVANIITGKLQILIKGIAGFIEGLDVSVFSDAVSTYYKTFSQSITNAIVSIDWQGIGSKIADFFLGIDWGGIFNALFGSFGAVLGGISGVIIGALSTAWEKVEAYFKTWIDKPAQFGGGIVNGILNGILYGLKDIVVWVWSNMVKPICDAFCEALGIHSPSTVFTEYGGYIVEGLLNGLVNTWHTITGFFGTALRGVSDAITNAWQSIKGSTMTIWNGIASVIKSAVNGVIAAINGMIAGAVNGINLVGQTLNRLSFTIPSWVPTYGGSVFGFNFPQISAPQIPYLAQGAVIPPNREFMAVLGDQKHGTNIEAPLDTIKQAMSEVMSGNQLLAEMREQNDLLRALLQKNTDIVLDGRSVAESVTKYQDNMARAGGW